MATPGTFSPGANPVGILNVPYIVQPSSVLKEISCSVYGCSDPLRTCVGKPKVSEHNSRAIVGTLMSTLANLPSNICVNRRLNLADQNRDPALASMHLYFLTLERCAPK